MSTKIGHFEILSELAKSATGAVYKATDPQTSQTVALKTIQLSAFGGSAVELERCLLAEAETTKVLSHSNVTCVFGAGEIDGQFCAAMEYIQGNSIATMLANQEGFSIWDLLDIGRQVCGGLDHAHSHKVFHASLEPAKIMCGWDSMVRILGYGVSSVGKFSASMPGVPQFLHYMSPEQVRGENIDARSNFFSLGAMFYEMVTNQKPFDGKDAASVRQNVLQSTPVPPLQLNPKLAVAYRNRGLTLREMKWYPEALVDYTEAIKLEPRNAVGYSNRGWVYRKQNKHAESLLDFNEAVRLAPTDVNYLVDRSAAFIDLARFADAITDCERALTIDPRNAPAYNNRGWSYHKLNQGKKALADLNEAIRLDPKSALYHGNRGRIHNRFHLFAAALADRREAVRLAPMQAARHNFLAWLLATCIDPAIRNGTEAITHALRACELTGWADPDYLDTLGVAHAEAGDWDKAIEWAHKAAEVAKGDLQTTLQKRLEQFIAHQPYREDPAWY